VSGARSGMSTTPRATFPSRSSGRTASDSSGRPTCGAGSTSTRYGPSLASGSPRPTSRPRAARTPGRSDVASSAAR